MFRWKNCYADVAASKHGIIVQSFFDDVIAPAIRALEEKITALGRSDNPGEVFVQGNRIRNFLARLSDSDSTEELFGAHGGWGGRISGMLFRGGGSAVRQRAAA